MGNAVVGLRAGLGRDRVPTSPGLDPYVGGEVLGSYQTTKSLGRYIAFPPKLARKIGIEETVFLLNLMYAASDEEEWVRRSVDEIEAETSLTYKQQCRVRNRLTNLGLIEEKTNRRIHLMCYRVVEEAFNELLETVKREFAQLTKGKVSNFPNGVSRTLPNGSSLKEQEELQEEEQELAREAETPSPKQEDVGVVFKEIKRAYRQKIGKNIGSPGNYGELFADFVEKKTGDVILGAAKLWMEEQDREFLRGVRWPFAMFMKHIAEHVEAYEDKLAGESEEAEEEGANFPRLGRRAGE